MDAKNRARHSAHPGSLRDQFQGQSVWQWLWLKLDGWRRRRKREGEPAPVSSLLSPPRRTEVAEDEVVNQNTLINLTHRIKSSGCTHSVTWMDGGIVGPQICAAGGGGGGRPPEAPGNQDVEGSGSADRMVISGRLSTGQTTGSAAQETHVYAQQQRNRQHEHVKEYKRPND